MLPRSKKLQPHRYGHTGKSDEFSRYLGVSESNRLVEIPIDENAYNEKLNSIGWIRILGGIAEFPGHKR